MKIPLAFSRQKKYLLPTGFIVLFALVGVAILFISHAATPYAAIEAENGTSCGTTSGSVTSTSDTKASNNCYIQFGTTSSSGGGGKPNIMVLVMENNDYGDIIGDPSVDPYMNSLASDYQSLTQMYAIDHDSLPNYLGLITGKTYYQYGWANQYSDGSNDDCSPDPNNCDISNSTTTLADQFDTAGISWKGFFEGMPSDCDQSDGSYGGYVARHDPFSYKYSLASSDCSKLVPVPQLSASTAQSPDAMITALNASSPPTFVFYAPTINNDAGGDDPGVSTIANGDAYLSKEIPAIQTTSWYKNGGTIILTFDEGDEQDTSDGIDGAVGGNIPTMIISTATENKGNYNTRIDIFGLLHSIENAYGLSCLGNACNSSAGSITL